MKMKVARNGLPNLPTLSDISGLDIKVEWMVDKLIPKQSVTVLHGKGGVGKSFLMLKIGCCTSEGTPFVGLVAQRTPSYYVDFENSIATLNSRGKVLGESSLKIWHVSNATMPPPRLDSKEWEKYKKLPPGLLIFDTLRASQLLDENSSRAMAFIMGRLKELRDKGFTIVLIHHSPKGNDQTFKGSTSISDLCDCALSLDRVNGGGQEIDGEDWNLPLRLGVRGKTRYEPFSIYLRFDPSKGFEKAEDPPDPDEESLKIIFDLIVRFKKGKKTAPNQSHIAEMVKDHAINKKRLLRLLKKGEGELWKVIADPHSKAKLYDPMIPKTVD
jgi:archaellum biogenesis ATPase FlaH